MLYHSTTLKHIIKMPHTNDHLQIYRKPVVNLRLEQVSFCPFLPDIFSLNETCVAPSKSGLYRFLGPSTPNVIMVPAPYGYPSHS